MYTPSFYCRIRRIKATMRFVSGGDRCSSLRTYYGDAKLGSICVSSDQLLQGHSFGTGTQLGRMRFLRTILRGGTDFGIHISPKTRILGHYIWLKSRNANLLGLEVVPSVDAPLLEGHKVNGISFLRGLVV
ncbi:hypothetical protein M404DRAFT_870993 [Pisolithus tinctorius Marx 270]|uniref:Uncharacterized protein n=1 Tax=Pisolithus tinctorius Marx 270 TaxID=870435 RepID=A0A0C3JN54_PISTI|nr:hypothetical protein M404DRAFT_870993 [Pisolithus tinctorius Marx 270]